MPGPTTDTRIYLLDPPEATTSPTGPAVIAPDGTREDLPPLVYRAVHHVIEALRAGQAVKVTPYRPDLPIDEAADAIGLAPDDFRAYVAAGAVPVHSTQYVDWVHLPDVIRWDNDRRDARRQAMDELLGEGPWDDDPPDPPRPAS